MHAASFCPFLTDAEVAEICAPLVMPSAQRRYLERLGMLVKAKPNGRPLVARGEFERVLVGRRADDAKTPPTAHPNRAALLKVIRGSRGSQHGPQA